MPILLLLLTFFCCSMTHTADTRLSLKPLGPVPAGFLTAWQPLPQDVLQQQVMPATTSESSAVSAQSVALLPTPLLPTPEIEEKKEIDFDACLRSALQYRRLVDAQPAINFFIDHGKPSYALELLWPHVERNFPPACGQAARILACSGNAEERNPQLASELYTHVLGSRNPSDKCDAACKIAELASFYPINVEQRVMNNVIGVLRAARHPMWPYFSEVKNLRQLEQEATEYAGTNRFPMVDLHKKYAIFADIKRKNPGTRLAPLCNMQMAHVINLGGLDRGLSPAECDDMQAHILHLVSNLNMRGMEIYDTQLIKKMAADNLFALATYDIDEQKRQELVTQAADLGHPYASLYRAEELQELPDISRARSMYEQVLHCSCTSGASVIARWRLGSIAFEQSEYSAGFDQYVELITDLKTIDVAEITDEEAKFCSQCKAPQCYCSNCFKDLAGFKRESAQKLFDTFCKLTEVTAEQAQFVCEHCPTQLEELCRRPIPKKAAKREQTKKLLEPLAQYDSRVKNRLAQVYRLQGDTDRVLTLYADLCADSQQDKLQLRLERARIYAQKNDFESICSELDLLQKEVSSKKHAISECTQFLCEFGKKQVYKDQQAVFEKALSLRPTDIESLCRMAKVVPRDKQEEQFKNIVEMRASAARDKKYKEKAAVAYAECLCERGDIAQAEFVLRDYVSAPALGVKAQCKFARAQKESQKNKKIKLYEEASILLTQGLESDPNSYACVYRRALQLAGSPSSDSTSVLKYLQQAITISEKRLKKSSISDYDKEKIKESLATCYSEYGMRLLHKYANMGSDKGSIKLVQSDDSSLLHYNFEYDQNGVQVTGEQFEEGVIHFKKAIEYGCVETHGTLANLYALKEAAWYDPQLAEKHYKAVVVAHAPHLFPVVAKYCEFLLKQRRFKDALNALDEVCELHPTVGLCVARGDLLIKGLGGRQDYQKAHKDFMFAASQCQGFVLKQNAEVLAELCLCTEKDFFMSSNRDLIAKEKKLDTIIAGGISRAYAHLTRGILSEHLAHMPDDERPGGKSFYQLLSIAMFHYQKANERDNGCLEAFLRLARMALDMDKKNILEEIVARKSVFPHHVIIARALCGLAEMEGEKENRDKALEYYQQAADMGLAIAWYNLGLWGPKELQIERYKKALELDEFEPNANNNMAAHCEIEQNFERARAFYARGACEHPSHPDICTNYARVLGWGIGGSRDLAEAHKFSKYAERARKFERNTVEAQARSVDRRLYGYLMRDKICNGPQEQNEIRQFVNDVTADHSIPREVHSVAYELLGRMEQELGNYDSATLNYRLALRLNNPYVLLNVRVCELIQHLKKETTDTKAKEQLIDAFIEECNQLKDKKGSSYVGFGLQAGMFIEKLQKIKNMPNKQAIKALVQTQKDKDSFDEVEAEKPKKLSPPKKKKKGNKKR